VNGKTHLHKMVSKKIFTTGLVLVSACSFIPACGQPVKTPATTQPPTQVENETPPETSTPEETKSEEVWSTVKIFTGIESTTTAPFNISSTEWRVIWTIDAQNPEYAVFDILVYPQDKSGIITKKISYSKGTSGDIVYIYKGGGDYYLKIITANLGKWTVTVEENTNRRINCPVQITYVNYKGMDYYGTTETGRDIIEFDEYVEIKNLSDSPQNISGWVLKNLTKGEPAFVFPTFKPCSCEWYTNWQECIEKCYPPGPCVIEPRESIRVYTGEAHPESGGYCFYYPPGNIWNNEIPDIAVLYNREGQEVSKKSYVIPTQNSVTSGE